MANNQIHRVSPELTNDAQFKAIEHIPTTMLKDGDTILVSSLTERMMPELMLLKSVALAPPPISFSALFHSLLRLDKKT